MKFKLILSARDIGAQDLSPEEIAQQIKEGVVDPSRVPIAFADALSDILGLKSKCEPVVADDEAAIEKAPPTPTVG